MAVSKKYRENKDHPFGEIHQIAKLMNMSDEGVRIYAGKGLVYPEVKKNSRIRSFDVMDFTMLLYSRVYQKSGFTLKEVEKLVNESSLDEIHTKYHKKMTDVDEEIERLQRAKACLEEVSASIDQIPELLNNCKITEFPGLYRIEFMNQGDMWNNDSEMIDLISEWTNYGPCTRISSRYSISLILEGKQPTEAMSGLGLLPEYAERFGVSPTERIIYVPPCDRAVHTIFAADNTQLIPDMSGLNRFIQDNHLTPTQDAVTLGFVNLNFNTTFTRYFHLWIPLEI